jgi:hypothetical protein
VTVVLCPGVTSERQCNHIEAPDGEACMWCSLNRAGRTSGGDASRTSGRNCYKVAARQQLEARGWACDSHDGLTSGGVAIVVLCALLLATILGVGAAYRFQWPSGVWARINGYHAARAEETPRASGSYQQVDFQA